MDKNRIKGRHGTTSWHNTAKSSGLPVEVNAVVVQGSIVFLPGETCRERSGQESAEAIVVGETSRSTNEHSKIAGGLTQRRADVVLSLCVFDQIKHTEIVTGGTVSRVGELRPWALHG